MLNPRNKPRFGTDPEAFFQKAGAIIGSEKLIPKNGLSNYSGRVVRDGVQFELNPRSADSIEALGKNIGGLFSAVQRVLDQNSGVSICFNGLVEVTEEELNSLSSDTRRLGCNPSKNAYGDKPITVNPLTYRKRSSGGHIHAGISNGSLMEQRDEIIYAYDIIVGNLCVMFDRDPGAAERRENYGRAGEYRTPDHGLEYRTTSNFWLRDYTLMHFVFGLSHIAYELAYQSFNGNRALWDTFAGRVDIGKVQKAIDTNDPALALNNFKRLAPFLRKQLPPEGFVLTPKNFDAVIGLAQGVQEKGIESYFPTEQIIPNWINGKQISFNDYLGGL